ncbi:type II toxin-antitoxin system PemK/MazF family toxin [Jeotgalibacillus proteolyticus]|uniref:Type II toxin-antitoxin system PemK/MazF family toxin n=1 Tax=Jeotgalibacillus proteolyticus TaxID=2082395 RepID=A0A2S5GB67_9BACL|nr:type II toxin-antitoxin system PemK/MazF family toxin [Jeotgalibacillus proteolyticus]PPA70164.1 hypothetical protein C4B60_11290 [Jeotgalibacillus proteolyticus]
MNRPLHAGAIIDTYMEYGGGRIDNYGRAGKNRPALVLSVDKNIMVLLAVKITGSGPTEDFKNRIEIKEWGRAGLSKKSYADLDEVLPITGDFSKLKVTGRLMTGDFRKILHAYITLQNE